MMLQICPPSAMQWTLVREWRDFTLLCQIDSAEEDDGVVSPNGWVEGGLDQNRHGVTHRLSASLTSNRELLIRTDGSTT